MPPVLSLNDEVNLKKADAITKALRATALVAEKYFGTNAAAGLSGKALKAYQMVNDPKHPMYGNAMFAALSGLMFDADVQVVSNKPVPPTFLAVMVDADGKPFIWVNSAGLARRTDGAKFTSKTVQTWDCRPANDAEVTAVVEGLFAARPAHTLKLFFGDGDEG